jgi:YbgC/YbaW family acyl-CoA thioester hydrolase
MITVKRKIQFHHCDPAGIMFYSRIFDFCHSAYEELINQVEMEEDYWQNEKFVVPIVKTEAQYLNPLSYDEEITIELTVSGIRNSGFELSYKCLNEDNETCALVKTVHVFIDVESWEKIDIDPLVRSELEKHT